MVTRSGSSLGVGGQGHGEGINVRGDQGQGEGSRSERFGSDGRWGLVVGEVGDK